MAIESLERAAQELYFYQKGTAGGFQTKLFDLIGHADYLNIEKIRAGFPWQVEAFERWQKAGNNGKDFFAEFKLPV